MSRLIDVNTTDIADAIRLGCRTMSSVFNADDNGIPFFESEVRPNPHLAFHEALSEAHVPGRHLNALLNAADAAAVKIDDKAVDKHTKALFFSFGGPVRLPLNRDKIGGKLVNCDLHNIREGLHGLYALVKFRNSSKAKQLAEECITTIGKLWDPIDGWDYAILKDRIGKEVGRWNFFMLELPRAIGPLVKYFEATGYEPALHLAISVKNRVIRDCFNENGEYNPELFGRHVHSITCVMSSLAQLAQLTSDGHLLDRVHSFYDNGLWQLRDAIGWAIEKTDPRTNSDKGEVNSTGDIVETALILARRGYTEYFEDAERILRCHLLPSQLRDVSFIKEPPNPKNEDGKRDIARRHVGAFGFPAPYGHEPVQAEKIQFCMDIVGGTVGSLCEVYRQITRFDKAGHWVNMLFDHETPWIKVESPYTHGILRIWLKQFGPLFVRIPSWTKNCQLLIDGKEAESQLNNGYLFVAKPPVKQWIEIKFPLIDRRIILKHRTRDIKVSLKGDEVIAMDNFGADLTFFDPIE